MENNPEADVILKKVHRCRDLQREYRHLSNLISEEVAAIYALAKARTDQILEEEFPGTYVDYFVNVEVGCVSLKWNPSVMLDSFDCVRKAARGWCFEDYCHDGHYYLVPPPVDEAKLKKVMKRIKKETGLHVELTKVNVTKVTPGLPDWYSVEKQE